MTPKTNPASAATRTGSGDAVCFGDEQFPGRKNPQNKQAQFFRSRKTKPACPVLRGNVPGSKSRLTQICSRLQRDVATLRRETASLREAVVSLQALSRPRVATIDAEVAAEREAAKLKRIEEREAAKREHAEAVAKQALVQPEKDRARAEWLAKDKARQRNAATKRTAAWRAANPERAKAISDRSNQKRKEERAARKQIRSGLDLLEPGREGCRVLLGRVPP
jgi:hypothetical protein